jgi:hypothetical protein
MYFLFLSAHSGKVLGLLVSVIPELSIVRDRLAQTRKAQKDPCRMAGVEKSCRKYFFAEIVCDIVLRHRPMNKKSFQTTGSIASNKGFVKRLAFLQLSCYREYRKTFAYL